MSINIEYNEKNYASNEALSVNQAKYQSLPIAALNVDTNDILLDTSAGVLVLDQSAAVVYTRDGSQQGIGYPRSAEAQQGNVGKLSVMSALGKLTQTEHRGGVYAGQKAGELIREICGDVSVNVQAAFEDILLYGWLPYVSPKGENGAKSGSARDNLMQVLFAIGGNLRASADGGLTISNLSASPSSAIKSDRIWMDEFSTTVEPPVTQLTVLEHQYIAGGELTTLFEGTTTAGQIIAFREPMSNLTATGFSIVSSSANYAVVSAGSGTLTGEKYVHTTREITKDVTTANVENVVRIEDATLVSITNSAETVNRLKEYYSRRETVRFTFDHNYETAGDVVTVESPDSGKEINACISQIVTEESAIAKATAEALVGFTPWQVVPFVDAHEILTASGTWTAPADLKPNTEAQVVLIAGGNGGTNGANGSSGGSSSKSGRITAGETVTSPAGSGGAGGAGGVKGTGGSIYRFSMIVNPGDTFAANIGAGGAAGGGTGGATTFAGRSSNEGAVSAAGYYDPVALTTYGKEGLDGLAGAAGGAGGSAGGSSANNGGSGGSVGSYSGGAGGRGTYSKGLYSDQVESLGGGGGGGAAKGANGSSGTTPTSGKSSGLGGSGASGAAAAAAANYGDGGNGGNGGGGGGGGGAWYYHYPSGSPTTTYNYSAAGGGGGAGSAGSAGKQGCVILFYRRPVTE